MSQQEALEAHHYAYDNNVPDRGSFMQGYYFGRSQSGGPYLTASFFCAGMSITSFLSMGGGLNLWDSVVVIALSLASFPIARAVTRGLFRLVYPA